MTTHPASSAPNWPDCQPVSQCGPWSVTMSGGMVLGAGMNAIGSVSVSGTVASAQSGTWTVSQGATPWNVAQSGNWTVGQANAPWTVAQSGTWTVNQGGSPWSMTLSGALPTGANTIGAVNVNGGNATAVLVREPSVRTVAAVGTAGTSGLLVSVGVAGGIKMTFSDGSTMTGYLPLGLNYLRCTPTAIVGLAIASPLLTAATILDAKATFES